MGQSASAYRVSGAIVLVVVLVPGVQLLVDARARKRDEQGGSWRA